ncbi:uncharacterized protein LOC143357817 [Halictus rubicundus]|uniref:uncharacterized protein LOC143357817 n=1 Tax=Halictus rubicundus TaxID=77578 RepID=UPI00403579A3
MKRLRFVYTILILYFIGQYTRVSCVKSNSVKLSLISLDHEFSNTNSGNKVHSLRELEELDVTDNTEDDLTNNGRTSRSPAGSRKHLRVGDAHQVANYFITGGPMKGHSHFVGSSNCEPNNDEGNVVGMNNPASNSDTDLPEDNENKDSADADANSFDSLVGLPYIPALHQLTRPHLLPQPIPHIPAGPGILRSILHPRLHHHFNRLHSIPGALVRAASLPIHGFLNAHHVLRNTLLPSIGHAEQGSLLGSANPADVGKINPGSDTVPSNEENAPVLGAYPTYPTSHNSKFPVTHLVHPDYFPHLQPTGYIVKFVPHVGDSYPPVVGSPQQSSDCADSDTDAEQNEGSVNNEEEDVGVAEQDDATEENKDVN